MIPAGEHRCCDWCGKPLTGRQERWCDPVHGIKGWRWEVLHKQHGVAVGVSGVETPPAGSVLASGGPSREAGGGCRLNGSRGGLQVSANRMLRVLTSDPLVLPEVQARRAVAAAMSDKQRERFLT